MSSPKQPPKPPPSGKRLDDPYVYGDTIPTADAQEKDTASAWALFNELTRKQENRFAPTTAGSGHVPLREPAATPAPGYEATAPAAMQHGAAAGREPPLGIDELMTEARRNNRVCPRLDDWQKLYALLPGKQEVEGRMQPPPPISPQAWRVTSAMVKRLCLRDHLEWAVSHDAVLPVLMFLRKLPEENWLHME
ncbi:hypothetical protein ACPWT1_12500 [Ramlibacter sp. MMS24-I3-19]|uniref:hypothetical protein n=1 Tax=Ramlibacter sp. MMS24-I3-19 TaxID=3416606 RepID=UPI003CFF2392